MVNTALTEISIDSFKSNFYGGARAYLFEYVPMFPINLYATGSEQSKSSAYLVKSTTFPEDSVEEIIVNWQGADFKMAGKRTFSDWTISFNVDRNSKLRETFDLWMSNMHSFKAKVDNIETAGSMRYGNLNEYMITQELSMLDWDGSTVIGSVKMYYAWPKSVGAITLDYSSMEIASFDVTFAYQYHIIESGNSASRPIPIPIVPK